MYETVILTGVMVSMLFTELTGLSAGLIVPGYLALALDSPWRIAYTIALALIAVGILRVISKGLVLYGRRRFTVLLLLTYFCDALLTMTGIIPAGISAIGILVPGLLAREIDRQGVRDTLFSVFITTVFLVLIRILIIHR